MSVNKSIIFYLDTNLQVYEVNIVNSQLKKITEIQKTGKVLGLFSDFGILWNDIYNSWIKNSDEIIFLIGHSAGFTDSRVVYMWLKSALMFDKIKFRLINVADKNDVKDDKIIELLNISDSSQLVYSGEPRIGKNHFENPKKPIL